jgi:NAD(P)-dependent dehydrogenase (short-subunit alcohol dehydrogenase family)
MKLVGEVAVVSGAAQGIGFAICEAFVAEGAQVVGLDIDADRLNAAFASLRPSTAAHALCVDVSDEAAVHAAVDAAAQQFGKVSVLVCNAAISTELNPVESIPTSAWRQALDVNLTSAFLLSKYAIPKLRDSGGGSVVIVASQMAKVGWMGQAAYCATKGALVQLAKVMALDHATENIRVNTLSPGGTATERLERRFGTLEEAERQWGPKHPVGRLGRVEEIARGAVFLASSDATFMTGSDLVMDGGYTAW